MRRAVSTELVFAFYIFGGTLLLAGCGGGGGGVTPPVSSSSGGGGGGTQTSVVLQVGSANPYTSDTGQIIAVANRSFTIQTGAGNVTVDTANMQEGMSYGSGIAVGSYAIALGTASGSTLDAIGVGTLTTPFGSVTDTGTISAFITDGFTMRSPTGYIHVFLTAATAVTGATRVSIGQTVQVTGSGSTSTQIAAASVIVTDPSDSSPSPSPTSSAAPGASPTPAAGPSSTPGAPIPIPTGVSTWSGTIASLIQGGFNMQTGNGYLNVYTGSATVIGGHPSVGDYVVATATGAPESGVTATYVSLSSSAPGSVSLTGTVAASTSYGFTLSVSASYPAVPIVLNSATIVGGEPLAVGAPIKVDGKGSLGSSVVAVQIAVVDPPAVEATPTPGPIAQTHILTGDYLGWGSNSSFDFAAAAPYLSWAQTSVANSTAIHSLGIHTQYYADPNRTQPASALYTAVESEFAHDCNANRVTVNYQGTTLYVMNVNASTLQSAWSSYIASSGGTFDAVFEDNAGPLSDFTPYEQFSAMPCNYSDASWISGGQTVNNVSPIPIIFNGLGGGSVSKSMGLLASSNTIGGTFENCLSDDTLLKMNGSLWGVIENTELQVAAQNKIFICMARSAASASANTDARLYDLASFLLTYNPQTSVLWEEYATPSNLHVNPETGLVPLDPKVPTPGNISALQQPGGSYGREYQQCYLRGQFVGACAVVVNPSGTGSVVFPYPQYTHTLLLSGAGVLDGGTVSTNGPPPSEYLGPDEAEVVFP